jgi:DNA glycosylase AlkZ-like
MLLERSRASVPRTLERMAGLQAQYAPSMYIGLWSRLAGFERGALERALERRAVVQGTLMRSTIHLVSRRDYWPFAVAIWEGRREWWLRTHRDGPSAAGVSAAARRLRRRLAGGSLRRTEIEEFFGKSGAELVAGIGHWLDLIRLPPSGTWERRRADLYAAAEAWLGPTKVSVEEAVDHLVRRYLGGFGPATGTEIAAWAGLPQRRIAPALDRLRLRRFRSEDGEELLDLPRAPLPDGESPAPVRFLPVFDATLLVHCRRTGILPEEHRPKVFNVKMPHSANTFLVDGAVAGTWKYEQERVRVDPFGRLQRAARRALGEQGERLAAFHA